MSAEQLSHAHTLSQAQEGSAKASRLLADTHWSAAMSTLNKTASQIQLFLVRRARATGRGGLLILEYQKSGAAPTDCRASDWTGERFQEMGARLLTRLTAGHLFEC